MDTQSHTHTQMYTSLAKHKLWPFSFWWKSPYLERQSSYWNGPGLSQASRTVSWLSRQVATLITIIFEMENPIPGNTDGSPQDYGKSMELISCAKFLILVIEMGPRKPFQYKHAILIVKGFPIHYKDRMTSQLSYLHNENSPYLQR